ncbi:MAG TPA: NADH-quinone oxidoreductase subunit L [Acidimicrobiales bacterium]|nr:NADH-quinone oxidoreductase subunit L [Acidimicrobiales bacterium]
MVHVAYLIPIFPLAGFALLTCFGRRLGNPLAGWLATLMVSASFVVSVVVFAGLFELAPARRSVDEQWFTWFSVDKLHVPVGALVDPLSMTMVTFVTGVSALIHLYSIGYMEHDRDFPKFFCYLNLFVFSMLMLVLGDNFLVTFFGWEGVGVCSYFLISFWFERPSAASAGKKAMIYNRVGDAGFLAAIFLVYERTQSLSYSTVFARLGHISGTDLTAIALLLFLGAVGKSAQLPLYPWLADAMEGPTPVSALIHAATMVTAGVYLMVRINPILHLSPDAAHTVAWIGAATAFIGATSACAQTDIKKVLAYSTVSQLGYMFLAAGTGAYTAAIFLMLTHAFYKALLFLDAGSVIHAMDDEQQLRRYGGLQPVMAITAFTFAVAWFAIAGVPGFSGWFSKGQVLEGAWKVTPALWAIGLVAALLTAYYIGRAYYLTFKGQQRWRNPRPTVANPTAGAGAPDEPHPHDPDLVMTLPLVLLAFLALAALLINLPGLDFLAKWLAPVLGNRSLVEGYSHATEWVFYIVDGLVAIAGVVVVAVLWGKSSEPRKLEPRFLYMAWFLDWSLDRFVARPGEVLASFTSAVVESRVIDGAVDAVGSLVGWSGSVLRKLQTGYVRTYALGFVAGAVALVAFLLVRAS